MKRALTSLAIVFLGSFVWALPANAYLGPGAGAGVITVVLGLLGSIILAIAGIVWYPLKRIFKKRSKKLQMPTKENIEENEMDTLNSNLHNSD